jgi:fructosamine-3-kinase
VFKADIDKEPFTVIIKACRTDGICLREARELEILGKDSLIKIPKVYFTFSATDSVPVDFICMEYVGGTNCFTDFSKLLNSRKNKEQFADEITSAVHRWHEQTNDKFGPLDNAVYDEWLDYYKPFAEEVLNCARDLVKSGKLEKKVLDAMERAWMKFDYIFSEKVERASLIHGDMNVMNIMSDRRLHPTAIIDPLESKWADSEYELFQFRNLTGDKFGLYETYKKKYPVSEKCDIKTSFYALYHEVYAYIISGTKVNSILMPLVKRMNKELDIIKE